jgi:hypothetical protein
MATLLVANPDGEPRSYDIPETGAGVGLGRKPDNEIVITDPHLSSYHASIRFDEASETFYLKDLGSHNGTRVNGAELEKDHELELKETDSIKFGILEATLLLSRPVRSLEPAPLRRPEIEAPAPVIPIIDVDTLKAATQKPPTTKNSDAPETVAVVDVCRELIKRLDLIDELLIRYKEVKKGEDVYADLEALKQSVQDMLGNYQVEPYSFDPETEINLDMRKKIQVVETLKTEGKEDKNRIVETLHEGYVRRLEGSQPVILRKAHVTTRTTVGVGK